MEIYIYIYTCSSFDDHGGRFSRSPGAAQMVDADASQLPSRPPLVSTRGGPWWRQSSNTGNTVDLNGRRHCARERLAFCFDRKHCLGFFGIFVLFGPVQAKPPLLIAEHYSGGVRAPHFLEFDILQLNWWGPGCWDCLLLMPSGSAVPSHRCVFTTLPTCTLPKRWTCCRSSSLYD